MEPKFQQDFAWPETDDGAVADDLDALVFNDSDARAVVADLFGSPARLRRASHGLRQVFATWGALA